MEEDEEGRVSTMPILLATAFSRRKEILERLVMLFNEL